MPPNFHDIPGPETSVTQEVKYRSTGLWSQSAGLKTVRSLTTLMAYTLSGILTGVAIVFAFRDDIPLNATNKHIVLCVIGYQFLMAQAILCLAPDSWSSTLSLKHRRWVHWFLQILGSVVALAGCFIKIIDKTNHWNTYHGQFALVSMVFTTVSLVNGVTSMYSYQLRGKIPPIISKLTHICFGIIAMGAASLALGYGFDKGFFRNWAHTAVADTFIIMTGILTTIVIINPFITFFTKSYSHFKN